MILEPGTVGPNRAIGYQDTLRELRLQTRISMLQLRERDEKSPPDHGTWQLDPIAIGYQDTHEMS